jgi:hypothetical protein
MNAEDKNQYLMDDKRLPITIKDTNSLYQTKINIDWIKTCDCKQNHLNCLTGKEWIKRSAWCLAILL